jgi:hypothetical protein
VQRFKTAPAPGRTDYDVNFAVSGDSRDNFTTWRQVQERVLRMGGSQPDFRSSPETPCSSAAPGRVGQWFEAPRPPWRACPS